MKSSRVAWALAALGLILLIVGVGVETCVRLQRFTGLLVAGEQGEQTVVRQAAGKRLPLLLARKGLHVARGLPSGAIPFLDADTALKHIDPALFYDALLLPFKVSLKRVEVLEEGEPENRLAVNLDGERSTGVFETGSEIVIGDVAWTAGEVRTWSGLVRHPEGRTRAAVSVRTPGGRWTEDLFLEPDNWLLLGPEVGLVFEWFDSEAAVKEALDGGLEALEAGRWGVADAGAVSWLGAFEPGTGLTRSDGVGVTFLGFAEDGRAIEVLLEEDGAARKVVVKAGGDGGEDGILFESPAACKAVFVMGACADGGAWVAAYRQGERLGQARLVEGDAWLPAQGPYELRLDQVMEHGVMVTKEDSPFLEAVLQGPEGEVSVREGEAVRVGDALVEFVREEPANSVRYRLELAGEEAEALDELNLGPEDEVRSGDWVFGQDPSRGVLRKPAFVRVSYAPVNAWSRLIFAAAFAALVAAVVLQGPLRQEDGAD